MRSSIQSEAELFGQHPGGTQHQRPPQRLSSVTQLYTHHTVKRYLQGYLPSSLALMFPPERINQTNCVLVYATRGVLASRRFCIALFFFDVVQCSFSHSLLLSLSLTQAWASTHSQTRVCVSVMTMMAVIKFFLQHPHSSSGNV